MKFNLPNFELSNLQKFSLKCLGNAENKELAKLMLTFCLIFNDFKDQIWLFTLLEPYHELDAPKKKTARLGQIRGMRAHCMRMIIATLREFLIVIKENKRLIASSDFSIVINNIDRKTKKKWQEIVELAEKEKSDDPFYKTIIKIRNSGTYHYKNMKSLFQGLQFYIKKEGVDGYLSLGENLERTRFYFGDASVQYYHKKLLDDYTCFDKELEKYVLNINKTLRFIIESYIISVLNVKLNV